MIHAARAGMCAGVVAVLAAGCAAPPDDLTDAFRELHPQLYDAWRAADRDALHATLARALTGEALTAAYVQTWTAMRRAADADASVDVLGVEYGEVAMVGPREVDATWWVRGIVRHQAHAHPRINHYRAVYTLTPTPDGWRVADTRLIDVTRVAAGLGGDALFDEEALPPAARGFMDPLELLQGME